MSVPGRVYLVSKTFDPILGLFSGVWAYHLYESRLQRPEGHGLVDLIKWKWARIQEGRRVDETEVEGWEELGQEIQRVQVGEKKGQ